jgi:YD repeat-containing protein
LESKPTHKTLMKYSVKTKTLQHLLISLLIKGSILCANAQTTLKEDNLNGKVVSLTETTYTAKMEKGGVVKDEYEEMFVYLYDNAGRMTQITQWDKYKKQAELTKYQYDEQGRLLVKTEYESKELKYTTKYSYTGNGKLSEEKYYSGPDAKYIGNKTYIYDSKGNNVETTENTNTTHIRTVKTYDGKNLLSEEDIYNTQTGKQVFKVMYDYDSSGHGSKVSRKNVQNGVLLITNYSYDDAGNLISSEFGNSKITWAYDKNRNLISYSNSGGTFSCEYTFDATGNWVKCVETHLNKNLSSYIRERKIEYLKEKK